MSDITPADALRELGDDQAEYAAAAAKKLGLPESRCVLKWPVPVDDTDHPIGAGPVVFVDANDHVNTVFVWTEEPQVVANGVRRARVYGTGQAIPDGDVHIGSTAVPPFVWHVYAAPVEESP